MELNYPLTAVILGFALIILELILGAALGFEFLIIGIFLIVSGGVGYATGSLSIQIVVFIALSLVYVFAGRKYIKNKLVIATKSTNVDQLIGKKTIVLKEIAPNSAGQVSMNGEVWRAVSDASHKEGTSVTVESVSGVTLKVS